MAAGEHLSGNQFVDLYHHTAPETADKIRSEGRFDSKHSGYTGGRDAFFTTHKGSEYASAFGEGVVHVKYPVKGERTLDDEFPSGEQHYAIDTRRIRKAMIQPG
jgi:hypothetical protein